MLSRSIDTTTITNYKNNQDRILSFLTASVTPIPNIHRHQQGNRFCASSMEPLHRPIKDTKDTTVTADGNVQVEDAKKTSLSVAEDRTLTAISSSISSNSLSKKGGNKDGTPAAKKQRIEDKPSPAEEQKKLPVEATHKLSPSDHRVVNVPLFDNSLRFPDQLWKLLQYESLKEAIWWLPPKNDAFVICVPLFSDLLLKSHFRGNKFASIIRKLNRWGFRKFVDRSLPANTVAYYHKYFEKGRPELLRAIEKIEDKGTDTLASQQQQQGVGLLPDAAATSFTTMTSPEMLAQMHHYQLQQQQQQQQQQSATASLAAFLGHSHDYSSNVTAAAAAHESAFQNGLSSFDNSLSTITSTPVNQRQESSILHSLLGQRNVSAVLPSTPSLGSGPVEGSGPRTLSSLIAARLASLSTQPSQQRGEGGGAAVPRTSMELATIPQSAMSAQPRLNRQAILASMVNNIERDRQQRQQSGSLQLLRQHQQQQEYISAEETKQESDTVNLLSLISARQDRSHLELRQQLLAQGTSQEERQFATLVAGLPQGTSSNNDRRTDGSNRDTNSDAVLLFMANRTKQQQQRQQSGETVISTSQMERERQHNLETQMEFRREYQAAVSYPSPHLASPFGQATLARGFLGQDDRISLPTLPVLTPQQRVREQIRQLQQQQLLEQAIQREAAFRRHQS